MKDKTDEIAAKIIGICAVPSHRVLGSVASELRAYGREVAAQATDRMHNGLYEQAGEIERLEAELVRAKSEAYAKGVRDSAEIVKKPIIDGTEKLPDAEYRYYYELKILALLEKKELTK